MKTPAINTKIINTLPVLISASLCAYFVWRFNKEQYFAALILGIIAGGLVDLDNGLTGKFKNVMFAVMAFSVSSLSVQFTFNNPIALPIAFTAIAFVFTLFGAAGTRYRTVSFGTLAVAIYTTLTHDPHAAPYLNTLLIIIGTLLYTLFTLLAHLLFPHRPVQENIAQAYDALADYLNSKASFFDPDEIDEHDQQQIQLAMTNSRVISSFNLCRNALFYRMRGQHRHPRTAKMLRYYFIAQDIHERMSASHMHYQTFTQQMSHTDLIYRIQRLIRLQAQACQQFAQNLRRNTEYTDFPKLARATQGAMQSLDYYAAHDTGNGASPYSVQRLLDNLSRISQQFAQLGNPDVRDLTTSTEQTRIQALDNNNFKTAWQIFKQQLTLQSPVFRHSVRMAVIACVCCIVVHLINSQHLNDNDLSLGYWILLTAVFVCQPNYSATKSRVYQRIAGTVLGVVVGSLVPYFTPSVETKLWIVIACTTLFFMSRSYKYSFSTFFITIQALTSFSLAGLDVYSAMPIRIIDTVIGAVLAWAAVSYLWPDWRYLTLDRTSAQAVQSNGAYLRAILDQLKNGSADDVGYRTIRRRAYESTAALSSTLSDMSGNPEKYGSRLQDGFTLLKTGYALTGNISALGAYRSQMAQDCGDSFAEGFYRAAYQTADLLEHMPQADEPAFQTALSDIRAGLEALRGQIPDNRQSYVLWQQLSLIVRQLAPCHQALARLKRPTASATANTAKAV